MATAPGRVNLIGEHTDYTGGLVLPMAIQFATTVSGEVTGDGAIRLRSTSSEDPVHLDLPVVDPAAVNPSWGRYVAAVAAELDADLDGTGFDGTVRSDIPMGSGLSSSAALEVAVALALGATCSSVELAQLCRRAEHVATGVPCGIMDQLASTAGVDGHALLIDCHSLATIPIELPPHLAIAVVHSGQRRELATTAYAARRDECARAESEIGPLREADADGWRGVTDPVARARARHVLSENRRVLEVVDALRADDPATVGRLLLEGHRSLRDDFEVSTPVLDELVDRLGATPGVWGARLTGAGFGGCVVAVCEPGTRIDGAWFVRPSAGARVLTI